MKQNRKPKWTPASAGKEYASSVMKGIAGGHDGMSTKASRIRNQKTFVKRTQLSIDEHVQGVLNHNRNIIARTITLIESNSLSHLEKSQKVLKALLPRSGNSIRIGITGVPGAGKSTFIESLGNYLLEKGHKVAVLAIDPSSSITKGSVLGDKTRMEVLSRHENCFIRPSPSSGNLGGVTRKTRETTLICEAAGYDIILIETVGVGQNEITVRSMVDFFLLLKISGAGDELQGIKKGVIELADAILINKADGDNIQRANIAKSDFERALHYLHPSTKGWESHAFTCSAIEGIGIDTIWNVILKFQEITKKSKVFEDRRKSQLREWIHAMVNDYLLQNFYNHPKVIEMLPILEAQVMLGRLPATKAAQDLLKLFENEGTVIE